jgi:hypothetical protein
MDLWHLDIRPALPNIPRPSFQLMQLPGVTALGQLAGQLRIRGDTGHVLHQHRSALLMRC